MWVVLGGFRLEKHQLTMALQLADWCLLFCCGRMHCSMKLERLWSCIIIIVLEWQYLQTLLVANSGPKIRFSRPFLFAVSSCALATTSEFVVGFRGIRRLGSAFIFLRWFKRVNICIQVITLHKGDKQGIISRNTTHPCS